MVGLSKILLLVQVSFAFAVWIVGIGRRNANAFAVGVLKGGPLTVAAVAVFGWIDVMVRHVGGVGLIDAHGQSFFAIGIVLD